MSFGGAAGRSRAIVGQEDRDRAPALRAVDREVGVERNADEPRPVVRSLPAVGEARATAPGSRSAAPSYVFPRARTRRMRPRAASREIPSRSPISWYVKPRRYRSAASCSFFVRHRPSRSRFFRRFLSGLHRLRRRPRSRRSRTDVRHTPRWRPTSVMFLPPARRSTVSACLPVMLEVSTSAMPTDGRSSWARSTTLGSARDSSSSTFRAVLRSHAAAGASGSARRSAAPSCRNARIRTSDLASSDRPSRRHAHIHAAGRSSSSLASNPETERGPPSALVIPPTVTSNCEICRDDPPPREVTSW